MIGEEGRPGKKLKKPVKVKKAERPPANPVVDVSSQNNIFLFPNSNNAIYFLFDQILHGI